ncbi:MAG: hypothetical protein MZV70_11505 [Desulfobacterales bacterium]|nr:hypothetical protein [Desulfobacterales bacterium]
MVLHSQTASEESKFDIDEAAKVITNKITADGIPMCLAI